MGEDFRQKYLDSQLENQRLTSLIEDLQRQLKETAQANKEAAEANKDLRILLKDLQEKLDVLIGQTKKTQ